MAQTIKLKRSSVAGNVPGSSDLSLGEIALNTADGAVYIKKGNNDIVAVADNDILHIDTTNSRVGIGTTSPSEKLTVNTGGNTTAGYFEINSSGVSRLKLGYSFTTAPSATNAAEIYVDAGGNLLISSRGNIASSMKFYTSGGTSPAEAMRIDTSGNLLVGTTSTVVGSASSGKGFRVDGANGIVQAAASGVVSAIFNRTSSDGDIVSFRKNGTTVGSIGSEGGNTLFIASDDAGLRFSGGSNVIVPCGVAGASSDGLISLGLGSLRFKDLHLSNNINLGGNSASPVFTLNKATTGSARIDFDNAGNIKARIELDSAENLQFKTGGTPTERLEITEAGVIKFNNAYTFPTADGSANQVLQTDGSGGLAFATIAGGGAVTAISDSDGDTKIQVEESSDEDVIRIDTGGTERVQVTSNGLNVVSSGGYRIAGTEVISSSKNLTNIGTISSGAITSSGIGSFANFKSLLDLNLERNDGTSPALVVQRFDRLRFITDTLGNYNQSSLGVNPSNVLFTDNGYAINTMTVIDASRNLTNIGTISSGAITSSGLLNLGGTGSLGSITNNQKILANFDGGYSTNNSVQNKVIGFIGTTKSTLDIFDSSYGTNGELQKNFYLGLSTGNSYFNNAKFVIVQGGVERFNMAQGGNATFAGTIASGAIDSTGTVSADNWFQVDSSQDLLKINISNWSGNEVQTVLKNGFNSTIKDHLIVKASGNAANNHGAIVISDEIFAYGKTEKSPTAASSLTAPFTSNSFQVTSSGNATFAGEVEAASLDINGAADISGNLEVHGNLTVNGTTTTLNSTTLDVDDLNITVAKGAADSAAANGGGLTIDGAGASMIWDHANSYIEFNKPVFSSHSFEVGTTDTKVGKLYNAAGVLNLYAYTARQIAFSNATNGEHVRIDADGKVGIGTTDPLTNLHIGSGTEGENLGLKLNRGSTTNFFVACDGTKQAYIGVDNSQGFMKMGSLSNHPVAICQNNGTAIYIDTSGNVGIGTASPFKTFEVSFNDNSTNVGASLSGGGTGSGVLIKNTNTTAGISANLDFRANNADARIAYKYNAINDGDFHFITDNTDSIETQMIIKNDGRVGIGVTSPDTTLHVQNTSSNGTVMQLTTTGDNREMTLQSDHIFSNGSFYLGNTSYQNIYRASTHKFEGGNLEITAKIQHAGDTDNYFSFATTDTQSFVTGNSTRLQITNSLVRFNQEGLNQDFQVFGANDDNLIFADASADKVGIGTNSPTSKVHISGTSDGTGAGADAMLHVKQNGTWSGNEPWALYVEGYSYLNGFRINAGDGIRSLYKTTSGGSLGFATSDTAPITFTQSNSAEKMRIHGNGFVGIGNTLPLARLSVEEYGIDTTSTSSSATTQIAVHTFAATQFRSARFTVQVTNSTDSTYHTTELLLVHNGTTANITEFGEIHTGSAAEATFDADISSGNVRLLATPASTDTMAFKVVCHSITT